MDVTDKELEGRYNPIIIIQLKSVDCIFKLTGICSWRQVRSTQVAVSMNTIFLL